MNQIVSDLYSRANGEFVRRQRMSAPNLSVEAQIRTPHLEVNVRTFQFDDPLDALFKPPMSYIDLSLDTRSGTGSSGAFHGPGSQTGFAPLGDCVLVPAGQTFHVRCEPVRRRVVCCMFDHEWLDALCGWHWEAPRLEQCRDLRVPAVRAAMLELAREALEPRFGSEVLAESLILSTLVHIARYLLQVKELPDKRGSKLAHWQLRLIREVIETASGPSPSLVELAELCRISPRHLARTFKNTLGITLGAFVADTRIRRAKMLLSRHDMIIKTVAFECGFQTPAAFAAAFRKATGQSPRDFRSDILLD